MIRTWLVWLALTLTWIALAAVASLCAIATILFTFTGAWVEACIAFGATTTLGVALILGGVYVDEHTP